MKKLLLVALALCFALGSEVLLFAQSKRTTNLFASLIDATASVQRAARQRTRRKRRHSGKRDNRMQPKTPPANTNNEPILDSPNRLEIDPGDIPPSERPTNPNEDRRTKIPEGIDPADMAPQNRKTKEGVETPASNQNSNNPKKLP